ncbi:MAG: EamA family transporter [Acidobacteriaceae bacterium]|nr:EamA family transporter [Acidobacteriaceae bacterium]
MHLRRQKRELDARTVLAFAAIYIIWGSSFYAIRVAVATMPPFFAAGLRFSIAGACLCLWSWLRSDPPPRGHQWRNLIVVGAFMFLGTYAGLFWAEKTLPSGIASLLVATIPVWTLLLEVFVFKLAALHIRTVLAVLAGLVGVLLIALNETETAGAVSTFACLAILASEISWAFATVLSKRVSLPSTPIATAGWQMLFGGLMLLLCSSLAREMRPPPHIAREAIIATVYLIVAASVLSFTAYIWLLARMSPTKVASYAYVNPVIALALGWWLGKESITVPTLLGAGCILASVSFIIFAKAGEPKSALEESGVRN